MGKKRNKTLTKKAPHFRVVASLVHTAHSWPRAITNAPNALYSVCLRAPLGYSSGNLSPVSVWEDENSHTGRQAESSVVVFFV